MSFNPHTYGNMTEDMTSVSSVVASRRPGEESVTLKPWPKGTL